MALIGLALKTPGRKYASAQRQIASYPELTSGANAPTLHPDQFRDDVVRVAGNREDGSDADRDDPKFGYRYLV